MVLAGLASLFFSLSIILSILIYPLITRLYELFEKLSTFQFLTNKYIQGVWNNIYVLVGVIVLFAIAIKLISTIVNPDSLSDNKKGVRGLYFRTVIAVVLIFVIPILFSYSFTLQDKLLDSNFLISRVFGYKISDETNTGQLLAWTTFSAFCTTEKKNENFEKAEKDITQISGILQSIRFSDPTGVLNAFGATGSGIRYHAILCPLAGFVVAYELFLLCMDTLFRAVKLSFLELMLPIVLGAFVFNPEILKKWAKEFFSTYLSLFLKVLAIGFMIISFVALKGKVYSDDFFDDWIMFGFFNVLFIIALLQLVKKIPDLINTIFGTHIKTAGGIKGRLGEMAGIGGLAQKAWASLGGFAKGVGATALTAGAAGIGMGAKKGFDAIANTNGKAGQIARDIKDTYGKLKNGNTGRVVSTMAAGIKSKGKGTGKAMLEAWNKSPVGAVSEQDRRTREQRNFNKTHGIDSTGQNPEFENPNYNTAFKRDSDAIKNGGNEMQAELDREKRYYKGKTDVAKRILEQNKNETKNEIPAAIDNHLENYGSEKEKLAQAELAQSNLNKAKNIFENAMSGASQGTEDYRRLQAIKNSIDLGNTWSDLKTDANGNKYTIPKDTADIIAKFQKQISDYNLGGYFAPNALNAGLEALSIYGDTTKGKLQMTDRSGGDIKVMIDKTNTRMDEEQKSIDAAVKEIKDEETRNKIYNHKNVIDVWTKTKVESEAKLDYVNSMHGQSIIKNENVIGTAPTPAQQPQPQPQPTPVQTLSQTPTPIVVSQDGRVTLDPNQNLVQPVIVQPEQPAINVSQDGKVQITSNDTQSPVADQIKKGDDSGQTVYNYITNNNNTVTPNEQAESSSDKKKSNKVEFDTSKLEEAMEKAGTEVVEAIQKDGSSTRKTMETEARNVTSATKSTNKNLEEINRKMPPKGNE